jgi:hypothetical protein
MMRRKRFIGGMALCDEAIQRSIHLNALLLVSFDVFSAVELGVLFID